MKKLSWILSKIILIPLLWIGLFLTVSTFLSLNTRSSLTHPLFYALLIGFVGRLLFTWVLKGLKWKDPFGFLDTLEHELTHAIFGYLTLSPPQSLLATSEKGGEVQFHGHNLLVALSPYFFPLTASLFLGLSFIISPSFLNTWHWFTFLLLGNYLYRLSLEVRWIQTDLSLFGRFFSLSFILLMLFLIFSVFFHVAHFISLSWMLQLPHTFQIIFESLVHQIVH